jgi:hypothetical protein
MHIKAKDGWVKGLDVRAFRAVMHYLSDSRGRFDAGVQVGDFMDMNCISRFVKGVPGEVYGESLAKDYEIANLVLDGMQVLLPKWTIIEGNHDVRPVALVKERPELAGQVEFAKNLDLSGRGVEFVPFWSRGTIKRLGKVGIIHGKYTGPNHLQKHLANYGMNLLYGHLHSCGYYPKTTFGDHTTMAAECIGCLCEYDQPYISGAPTNWQQALTELIVFPNGNFQTTTIKIVNHRFVGANGVVYDGNKVPPAIETLFPFRIYKEKK